VHLLVDFFQHIQLTEREILTTLHSMKNILKEHLTQNLTSMKVKEILPDTHREGLDKSVTNSVME
jgi:hypothetical protein